SDWHVSDFHLGVHPVWVGMIVNVIVLVLVTLVQAGSRATWRADRGGVLALSGALVLPVVTALGAPVLHPLGLTGPLVLVTAVLVLVAAVRTVRAVDAPSDSAGPRHPLEQAAGSAAG
ncbi:MAG: hypothetical protein L0J57_13615, partial [Brachybacterium sp.]|nr:hypothetical protein [Brachybacterium sp.]